MKDWYQPDEIWEVFGIKTREQYVYLHVYEARFYAGVLEAVVCAYTTARLLPSRSYSAASVMPAPAPTKRPMGWYWSNSISGAK